MTRKILILAALAALGAVAALSLPSSGRATDWSELSGLGYGVSQTVVDSTCTRVTAVTGYGPGTVSGDLGCTSAPGFQAAVDSFVAQTCHVAVFSETSAPCAQPPAPAPTTTDPAAVPPPTDSTTTALSPVPVPVPAPALTTTDATVPSPAPTAVETTAPTVSTAATGPTTADLQAQIDELRASIATVTAELHRLVCALQTWGPTMDPAILATVMSLDSTCSS